MIFRPFLRGIQVSRFPSETFSRALQPIYTPKGTNLQNLSEIGKIHLHIYFGILKHAPLKYETCRPNFVSRIGYDTGDGMVCLGWLNLGLTKNTTILPSHEGALDDQVPSSLHTEDLCPLSAYPSLHANSVMPNTLRELRTNVPFLGGANGKHRIAGEKRTKHEAAQPLTFPILLVFLSKYERQRSYFSELRPSKSALRSFLCRSPND